MRLTQQEANLEKNQKAWKESGLNLLAEINDRMFVTLTENEWDAYDVFGDLLDNLMSNHPSLQDSWSGMTTDQKWNFVEFVWYGIRPIVCGALGYEQVGKGYSGKEYFEKINSELKGKYE